MGKGIDYGMGTTNIDRDSGIRYGVISSHAISCYAVDDFEADYGDPTCPKCGADVEEWDCEKHDDYNQYRERGCEDYACEGCELSFDSEYVYCDEPLGHNINDGEYKATMHSDGDIFVLKSPYYTHAQYCSPCAPGACHLENPCDDGDRAYCFGHDWFEGEVAPYTVYSVATGEVVSPPAK